jgi:hypothetical protein
MLPSPPHPVLRAEPLSASVPRPTDAQEMDPDPTRLKPLRNPFSPEEDASSMEQGRFD